MGATNMQNNPYVPWPSKILDVIKHTQKEYTSSTPIDAADYTAWVQSWMEDAHEIAINYHNLDTENLSKLQE